MFFLHAPQTPDDPDRRHFAARIGHGVSTDLRLWEVRGDALAPGPAGSWDDLATWTGSVVPHPEGGWAMLYTGVSSREQGLVQRIGLARSDDLSVWVKYPGNPVIEADPSWYELLDTDVWFDQAWRDPWLARDPDRGVFYALITARARRGPPNGRGVIARATSPDLVAWEVGPPLSAPDGFGYMEIPQVLYQEGLWHLLFSAPAWRRRRDPGRTAPGRFMQSRTGSMVPTRRWPHSSATKLDLSTVPRSWSETPGCGVSHSAIGTVRAASSGNSPTRCRSCSVRTAR